MDIHLLLNAQEELKQEHFERWLFLLESAVRTNFEGERAEQMLKSAHSIGAMMQFKVELM